MDHLQNITHDANAVSICIFCNHKEQTEQTHANLVASLLKQLVEERGTVSEHVKKLYQEHTRKNTRPTIQNFLDVLKLEIDNVYQTVFIVVDALDEASEGTQTSLVSNLRSISPAIRLLITSRDLNSIKAAMVGTPQLWIYAHPEDIKQYIEARLCASYRLRGLLERDSELQSDFIPMVLDKSGGM
jgi:hypothetical protein